MAFFLRKFSLGHNNFLNLGLNGKQVEVRITCHGKRTLNLSPTELHVLQNAAPTLMTEGVMLSSSYDDYVHFPVVRRCDPSEDGAHLKFVRETMTDAQPLDPEDNIRVEFKLESDSVRAFLRFLPNIITIAEHIMSQEPAIVLAYNIVGDQIKRLCDANGNERTYEHFLFIMRLLHQYIPLSFLVKDFKRNCVVEPTINPYELFKTVLLQFEYIYANLFTQ